MTDSFPLPALLGGLPVRPQGPPDWPTADESVLQALQEAYHNGSWGKYQGNYVRQLEQRLGEYHDVAFVATCGSGTYAVEVALRALKIGASDEVVLAAYDYPGNFLSVHAVGAMPVLAEISADNWNLNLAGVAQAIGPATRAVIASHLHGGVVPMSEIMAIARAYKLAVIEDAAQMPGAVVQGRKAGTWGDVGILSFGGSKLLTAGRGGAILTRHADVHQRLRRLLHRGNLVCPLSELQACVLLPQLDRLDARNACRAANVRRLCEMLKDVPGIVPFRNTCADSEGSGEWGVGSGECIVPFRNTCADSEAGYYKVGFQYDGERFGLAREDYHGGAGGRHCHRQGLPGIARRPVSQPFSARRQSGRSDPGPSWCRGLAPSRVTGRACRDGGD